MFFLLSNRMLFINHYLFVARGIVVAVAVCVRVWRSHRRVMTSISKVFYIR